MAVLWRNPGPSWHIEGTGNFFGYGNSAILLQNNDGAVALWDMQRHQHSSAAVLWR